MAEELDLTEVLSAVETVRRNYRKPLPGFKTRPKPTQIPNAGEAGDRQNCGAVALCADDRKP